MKTERVIAGVLLLLLALPVSASPRKEAPSPVPAAAAAEPAVTAPAVSAADVAEPAAPEAVIVTDMIGRKVQVVPGSYRRVVCIGAGALRMYSIIGDVNVLCGVEDIDNETLSQRPRMFDSVARPYVIAFGSVFSTLPSCGVGGPMAQTAEAEKILMCDPDIIISEYEDKEKEDALQEQLGVPVITLKSGKDGVFDDSFARSMRLLGTLFAAEEKAEQVVSYVAAQKDELMRRTAGVTEKPEVYICGLGNWGTTNHLMTAEDYVGFTLCNIENVVKDLGQKGIQPIEKEKFVALGDDMDIMIIDAAAVKNIKPLYGEDPTLFDSCRAWREGNVYLQMAYNAYYTNYEIALVNTWFVAKQVYPELFGDVDITAKMNEVTSLFYGQPLADRIFAKPSSFGGYQKIDTATFFN